MVEAKGQPTEGTDVAENDSGFTDEERAAMAERAKEVKNARRGKKTDGTADVLAKIAAMADVDRALAERVHAIVLAAASQLTPRTWYGMPAYALDGKVICFFQEAGKFKSRYATLGFSDNAALDDGPMWATAFAIVELTSEVEHRIAELVTRAVGSK